jgi:hypothetical protein
MVVGVMAMMFGMATARTASDDGGIQLGIALGVFGLIYLVAARTAAWWHHG